MDSSCTITSFVGDVFICTLQYAEFSFLNKFYCLLYQSLIPNCSLTIKTLRQEHLNISHSVQQYILSGDGRRLRCQRLINFLLVHLDNVKDYSQFCHYLNLVTIITDLPYRMIAGIQMYDSVYNCNLNNYKPFLEVNLGIMLVTTRISSLVFQILSIKNFLKNLECACVICKID